MHQGGAAAVCAGLIAEERPVAQHHHPIRERAREVLVVRDEQERQPLGAQAAQQRDERARALAVERARGLVHEQRLGREGEGARDGGALQFAAGKLARAGVGARRDAHALEQRARVAQRRLGRASCDVDGRERDVLDDREVREEVPLLEHEADAAAHARDGALVVGLAGAERVAAHAHRAGVGALEPVEAAQQRRLARARRAHDGDRLARAHAQRDAVEERAPTEALREPGDLDHAPPMSRPVSNPSAPVIKQPTSVTPMLRKPSRNDPCCHRRMVSKLKLE